MLGILFGSLALAYYIAIECLTEGQAFTAVWLFLAVLSLAAGFYKRYRKKHPSKKKLSLWWETFWRTSAGILCVLLLVVFGRILTGMFSSLPPGMDYIVVLSQTEIPGETENELNNRLDCAAVYLTQNPRAKVIVSGGWNSSEGYSKAHTMYQYLMRKGIGSGRILWETQSRNTMENLRYSMSICGGPYGSLGVVSSDFFSYRAVRIARNVGMQNVRGLSVTTPSWLWPHRVVLEILCVLRDKFLGI